MDVKRVCSSYDATSQKDPSEETIDDGKHVIKRYQELFDSESMSDIVLVVGLSRYSAHKFVLTTASEVFQAMLSEDRWQEGSQSEVTLTEEEECLPVFRDFLRYLYCGSITLMTTTVLPVLVLADKYCIRPLCESCVQYMLQHIVESPDTNRALSWYQYAKISGYTQLQEETLRFILSNFHIVQNSPDWLMLNKSEVQEFLRSSDIVVESEYHLWKKLAEWFEHQDEVAVALKELLPLVRFSLMTPKQLYEIESSELYKEHKQLFSEKFLQAYRRHSLLSEDVEKLSNTMVEPHRNFSSPDYGISCSLTLINYQVKAKIDSKIIVDNFKVPLQFNPSSNKIDQMKACFHVEFFPKGYFQPHVLYHTYLGKHNEKTTLVIRRMNPLCIPEIVSVEVTMVIYGKKNQVQYVAHTVTASHQFCQKTPKLEIEDVISMEKFQENNSRYLVNGRLEAALFLKVTGVQDARDGNKK
uniref:BTB/POZ domain-containing protein 17-like n=1 Tax=Crassostrea virginica TaxID=6565 RepID=A0A8B8ALZ4_CRAVI|nr:BTB/POZ domain-containing protein 17-like [Crassostrea virginica]XP_022291078.1 BTB/POZ domain-containing protein 17-like [Crassostrea virginica]XP_022291079.1 BTB/POZ domain-containing protein 17-like [Crassostrea virginica]XP_022291080.1 BTB/POZ domain-containing protein 17-like [Crassostrea virginica]XP_022291082.1 BTB/POZ domain-containing protein 17-like [Crassostrea virginica]